MNTLLAPRNLRQILITGACGLVIATIYAFVAPKWYESTLAVVPSAAPSGLPIGAGALGGAMDLAASLSGSGGDIDHIAAVFKSRSVSDTIIQKFDLNKRYEEEFIEDTRDDLWRHCDVSAEKKGNTISITCEDKDPAIAMAMTAYFGEIANHTLSQVSVTSAREERIFLEKRLEQAHRDVNDIAAKLRTFQETHKLVDISEQARAVVTAMAQLRGEQMSKEMQLTYLESFASRDEVSAQQLRQQIRILGDKITTLEQARNVTVSSGKSSDLFPGAMTLPQLRFQMEDLFRDQKVQETLFMFVTQQLEMAKVNEARDTPTIQVLDAPVIATKKARPRRALVMAIGLFLSLMLGAGWVMVPVWLKELPRLHTLNIDP